MIVTEGKMAYLMEDDTEDGVIVLSDEECEYIQDNSTGLLAPYDEFIKMMVKDDNQDDIITFEGEATSDECDLKMFDYPVDKVICAAVFEYTNPSGQQCIKFGDFSLYDCVWWDCKYKLGENAEFDAWYAKMKAIWKNSEYAKDNN